MTTQQPTEHSPRFGFVVFTGRHKILDYHQPKKGQQIATADDEDAARMIVRALNEREELIATLRSIADGEHAMEPCATRYARRDRNAKPFKCDCSVSIASTVLERVEKGSRQ